MDSFLDLRSELPSDGDEQVGENSDQGDKKKTSGLRIIYYHGHGDRDEDMRFIPLR